MQQKTAQTDICTKKKRGVTFRERGFIMADGAPVNNVARREIESSMANIHDSLVSAEEEIYSRIRPIGSTDRENIAQTIYCSLPQSTGCDVSQTRWGHTLDLRQV